MGRRPCCPKEGLNRGAWTAIEDQILMDFINSHGEGSWRNLPKRAGLKRCGKSCRLRWLNYLRPDIKRGNITSDEEDLIIRLHKLLGNRWSLIAGRLPGRTDNEIKNYWNTHLRKKVHRAPTPANEPPRPKLESNKVVRAKPVRCTKVFIEPLQPPINSPYALSLSHPIIRGVENGRDHESAGLVDHTYPEFTINCENAKQFFNFSLSDFLDDEMLDIGELRKETSCDDRMIENWGGKCGDIDAYELENWLNDNLTPLTASQTC